MTTEKPSIGVEVDCGSAPRQGFGRRFFDDARFIIILLAIVGFFASGMVYNLYSQIEKKIDKDQHQREIASLNDKIDTKFDAIKSETALIVKMLEGKKDKR